MYGWASKYYDKLYSTKDYKAEAFAIAEIVLKHCPSANALLDVACGTGAHMEYLTEHFNVEGLDLSKELVAVARARLPKVKVHVANMMRFNFHRKFDAVICMFSSIGYSRSYSGLKRAIGCMARHLTYKGVLIVEPWFTEQTWKPKSVYATFVDESDVKLARISTNRTARKLSIIEMEYLVGAEGKVRHIKEHHEMGLFSHDEMIEAFRLAGLKCEYNEKGITGKGLYIGQNDTLKEDGI